MGFYQKLMGLSDVQVEAGEKTASGLHVRGVPIPGLHYRVNHRCALVNTQAANSRLFELRNTHASQLVALTRLDIKWINSGAHTAFIEDSLDCYKCTGFSAVDTTNTVTPVASSKRTSFGADAVAAIRGVTIAGAAAGMTGGTLTKDTSSFAQLPRILNQTVEATTETSPRVADVLRALEDEFGAYPFVFAQNEGFIVENRVLLGAAASSSVYIDCAFVVCAAF